MAHRLPLSRLIAVVLTALSLAGVLTPNKAGADDAQRALLAKAVLSEDANEQQDLIKQLVGANDPVIEQAMIAWRGGSLYLLETNDTKIPFLLEAQTDADGLAKGIRITDGQVFKDAAGSPLLFSATDLTSADANAKLRKAIKTALDLFALGNPNPKMRRDAVTKLGQEQNVDYLPHFEARQNVEQDKEVLGSLVEAVAITQLANDDPLIRNRAIVLLGERRSINALTVLQKLEADAKADLKKYGDETLKTAHTSVHQIQSYMAWGNLVGTAFRGLSTSAVLLVAALGLAITFGLMGIINMAHGEIMMIGAYTAFVTQNIFRDQFGGSGAGFDCYFIVALAASFVVAGLFGLALERGIIRFLYKRPLESLLATWGVSLVLQQLVRATFGAANVQVDSPSWMSGSFVVNDVLFGYSRIFIIGFAVFIVFGTYLLLTRTSLGLQIRAVMQNRNMASCVGVRTDRVNMMTFAFGSGLAGMAGACMSQIANVGPSLGQNYIVDCFMAVVLGGVGSIFGTVSASLGVGVTNQILEPWMGAVLAKIVVLTAIILFLQWRPAGLFVTKSRSLEG